MNELGREGQAARLSSVELAELIVDALLRAGLVDHSAARRAVEVASEEIAVRKALGDY